MPKHLNSASPKVQSGEKFIEFLQKLIDFFVFVFIENNNNIITFSYLKEKRKPYELFYFD